MVSFLFICPNWLQTIWMQQSARLLRIPAPTKAKRSISLHHKMRVSVLE